MEQFTLIEIFSYTANVVFVTWGVVAVFKDRSRKKEIANFSMLPLRWQ